MSLRLNIGSEQKKVLDDLITQRLWAKLVMRKWLNRSASEPDYGADTEDESENVDVGLENYYSSSDEGSCFFFLALSQESPVHLFRLPKPFKSV